MSDARKYITGSISKINTDLRYGFVEVPKMGKVFFSKNTVYANTTFTKLEIGMKVKISAKETERGLFAESLSLTSLKPKKTTKKP